VSGSRGLISGFCSSLKWINLSTLSSEVKVTTKIAGMDLLCPNKSDTLWFYNYSPLDRGDRDLHEYGRGLRRTGNMRICAEVQASDDPLERYTTT
jgi:hypothetical protein